MAAEALKNAWYAGRPIVPIVGAGLSADSGYPVIASIVRYFGKLHQYIKFRGFLPENPIEGGDPLNGLFDVYRRKPWKYIEHFGWPDRFQLNQDLLAQLQEQKRAD